ncbi:hypothetical protein Celaphus_00003494 [Cervus elaphus hippelaphus]|uniref:Uncharacterized protein n=1 Tax=Cervus elaphus hippelaphus TaxID=46360 RepID=A0A212D2Y4_CEREH|nr:hypothetical protein Celaphus_00003494 [Cervus elaphus hippelaphus]
MHLVARCPRLRHYKERHESALSGGGTARPGRAFESVVRERPGSASVSAAEPAVSSRRVGTSGPRGVIGGEEPRASAQYVGSG